MLLNFLHKREFGFSGMAFGVMDGVVTVLSVLVGLGSVTDKSAVFIAMIIVGLADSMANAAGIRVSQETVVHSTKKQVFMSMLFAFLGTFVVTIALTVPLIFLGFYEAVFVSIFLGFAFMAGLAVFVGVRRLYNRKQMMRLIAEYILTAIIIISISYTLGVLYRNPWVILWLQN